MRRNSRRAFLFPSLISFSFVFFFPSISFDNIVLIPSLLPLRADFKLIGNKVMLMDIYTYKQVKYAKSIIIFGDHEDKAPKQILY